ncbi:10670_t:CDS:10, partial [Ambispora leptoticha]
YIREESFEGNNKYQTKTYGLQNAKKGVIFKSFPPVLRIQLNRFEYDMQRDATVKINDRHEYPMEIDLQSYLSSDSDKSISYNYLLHGVIVHNGELREGSYYVLLKPENNGQWFKFDDNGATPVTDQNVLEDNYGGEVTNESRTNVNQFTSAYILVYIRESDIDFVLSPVLAKDIPEHLQRRLDEEKALCAQKQREAEERHFYLYIRLVTPATFVRYQGFDLANFNNRQFPLSEVPQFKVLKSVKYSTFKAMIAHKFWISPEQMRLWVLVNRQNRTVRPDTPIPDNFLDIDMKAICKKMGRRQDEMKLFLEIADKPIMVWFPPIGENTNILVFIKYFNPDTQSLEGMCYLYVQKYGKVGDIIPILCEKKNFPSHTHLKIYEEIKPSMIEEMRPILTFQQSEMQNGDIICFQKVLTEEEIRIHTAAGRICDIPTFYESLLNRVVVEFKPKHEDRELKPEFKLILNEKYTYDEVAKRVSAFLNTDPLKLRFSTAHPMSGTYETVIKRTTKQTLSELLQTTYLPNSTRLLYYKMLDISIIELETKKFFKVYWLGTTVKEERMIDVCLPGTAIINEVLRIIVQKLALLIPSYRIRLYDVLNYKIQNEYDINDPIDKIQEHMTLYAE